MSAAKAMMSVGAAVLLSAAASQPLSAAEVHRLQRQSAVASCKAATPAYREMLRARPLALANAGVGDAFVSCAWTGTRPGSGRRVPWIAILVGNRGGATATVDCTFVHGSATADAGNRIYVTRTVALFPGYYDWPYLYSSHLGLAQQDVGELQASCRLPSGTEVGMLELGYYESVGA